METGIELKRFGLKLRQAADQFDSEMEWARRWHITFNLIMEVLRALL